MKAIKQDAKNTLVRKEEGNDDRGWAEEEVSLRNNTYVENKNEKARPEER